MRDLAPGMCDDYPTGRNVFLTQNAVAKPTTVHLVLSNSAAAQPSTGYIFPPNSSFTLPAGTFAHPACKICGNTGGLCCLVAHFFAANPRENSVNLYCSCPRCAPTC